MRSNLFDYWPSARPFERTINYETWANDEAYEVRVDLPGVEQEKIEATVEDNILRIKWKRVFENEAYKDRTCYKDNLLSFNLPEDVSTSKITSSLKNGVLKMSLPKKTAKKPREIAIQIE